MNDFVAFLVIVVTFGSLLLVCYWRDRQEEKERDEFIRWEIERDSMEGEDE